MELELSMLDLRYERLRSRNVRRERQLLGSLAESGQQMPIVVVAGGDAEKHIVIDGYKRVRALKRLAQDTVRTTLWEVAEADALLLDRLMRTSTTEGAFEQGWLLKELMVRFGLSQEELARRFDRSKSWVSRHLALVEDLPMSIQEHVRAGKLCAHAAMKHLVPLARANTEAAECLVMAIGHLSLSTREVGTLCAGWQASDEKARELILNKPMVFLRARAEAQKDDGNKNPCEQLISELDAISGMARRARKQLGRGFWRRLSHTEQDEVSRCFRQVQSDVTAFATRLEKEVADARPEHAIGDSQAA